MIKKLVIVFFAIFLLLGEKQVFAQDPEFSQFYANPLYLNPAFAGASVCPRIILNYRNQWPSISGTFVTYDASFDQHIDKIAGGVGVMFMGDRQGEGVINTYNLSAMYSYRLDLSRKWALKAALQATYAQKSLDWDKLSFGDQIHPRYGFVFNSSETKPGSLTKGYADFSSGVILYSEDLFAGVAVHHMTEPQEGFISISHLPVKLTIHAGGVIGLRKKNTRGRTIEDPTISPNIIYQQQLNFHQLDYGFYLNKYPFVGGVWYRQNFESSDAFIVLFGIMYDFFKFGYSYDLTVSKLTNVTGGAHEVSVAFQLKCPDKRRRIKSISCPSF